jgi:chromosome segregation ATPase
MWLLPNPFSRSAIRPKVIEIFYFLHKNTRCLISREFEKEEIMALKKQTPKKSLTLRSKKANPKKIIAKKTIFPILNTKDLPATQGMLTLVQNQIKTGLLSLDKKTQSRFDTVDARFSQVDAEFANIRSEFSKMNSRFSKIDSRFSEMDSKFASLHSELSRIAVIIEAQDSRNRFVLEGYEQVYHRQDRFEQKIDQRVHAQEEIIATNAKPTPDPA